MLSLAVYLEGGLANDAEWQLKVKEMEEEDPSSEIEKDPAESKASISVLDTVKIKSDAALATSDGNESVKQVASQIASYFGLESSGTEQ